MGDSRYDDIDDEWDRVFPILRSRGMSLDSDGLREIWREGVKLMDENVLRFALDSGAISPGLKDIVEDELFSRAVVKELESDVDS